MTLTDIAHSAGVSVATVSKAFRESSEINPKTREKIFAIARQMGCFDKYYKQKYDKKIVAIICPELSSEFYSKAVDKLENKLNQIGILTVVSISRFSPDIEKALFEYHAFIQKADGIIIFGNAKKIVNPDNIPTVVIYSNSDITDAIQLDIQKAIRESIKYLLDNGHKKIGFIGDNYTNEKYQNYISAMKVYNLNPDETYISISSKRHEDAGYEAMSEILKENSHPTAIIAAYDYMAIGAVRCINEHGLKVPDNISIISMDDISALSYIDTPLTSIRFMNDETINLTIELLMKKFENKYYRTRSKIITDGILIKRNSVKNIKKSK